MMRRWGSALAFGILIVAAVAVVLSFATYSGLDAEGRSEVNREIPKATYQFILVVVLGACIKYLVDRYQDDRAQVRKAEEAAAAQQRKLDELRSEWIQRLVAVTNTVRRAPILVQAHRSAKAYNEQMIQITNAYLDLRSLRHEVDNMGPIDNRAFERWTDIKLDIRQMESYLDTIVGEWTVVYKDLSELQRQAEQERDLQTKVWERLQGLPQLSELLLQADDGKSPVSDQFYAGYLARYQHALGLMRDQLLDALQESVPDGSPVATVEESQTPRSSGTPSPSGGRSKQGEVLMAEAQHD